MIKNSYKGFVCLLLLAVTTAQAEVMQNILEILIGNT